MSLIKAILTAAIAAAAVATPALADFRYQGSPKFGEYYIYTSPQVSRADAVTRAAAPLNANAAMSGDKTPFKGGIGNRAP